MIKMKQCTCGKLATNFHSKCCNAHFEGIINKNGKYIIACEKCGKYVADITFPKVNS